MQHLYHLHDFHVGGQPLLWCQCITQITRIKKIPSDPHLPHAFHMLHIRKHVPSHEGALCVRRYNHSLHTLCGTVQRYRRTVKDSKGLYRPLRLRLCLPKSRFRDRARPDLGQRVRTRGKDGLDGKTAHTIYPFIYIYGLSSAQRTRKAANWNLGQCWFHGLLVTFSNAGQVVRRRTLHSAQCYVCDWAIDRSRTLQKTSSSCICAGRKRINRWQSDVSMQNCIETVFRWRSNASPRENRDYNLHLFDGWVSTCSLHNTCV